MAYQEEGAARHSPGVTAEAMGFTSERIEVDGESVQYFISTAGRPVDRARRLPLIVFLQGSGAAPIYFGTAPKLGRSTIFNPPDFPGHHYVVISKPGVPFHSEQRAAGSDEYDRRTSLDARVASVKAVMDHLATQSWVDTKRMALVGHSEGADVAPWAAAACKHVTHVVALAPSAVSQMLEFTIMERGKAARGEQTQEQATGAIQSHLEAYRAIFSEPDNWRKKWRGHSYLRWSSFMRPAIDAYRRIDVPILAIAGRFDRNTPCESGEALQLEFLRIGKRNLTFEMWPVDHYFVEQVEGERVDRRRDVGPRILEWLKVHDRKEPKRDSK